MPTRFRLTAVLSGLVIATLGFASPAFADGLSITDPARDMVGYCDPNPSDCPAGGTVPSRTDGDMLKSGITHSAKNLMVRTYFTSLNKPGKKSGTWTFVVQSYASGTTRTYQVAVATGGTSNGRSTDGITLIINKGNNTLVSCSGRKTSVNYDREKIKVIIPRTCLRNPYRVRLAAFFYQRPTTAHGLAGYRDRSLTSYTEWIRHD